MSDGVLWATLLYLLPVALAVAVAAVLERFWPWRRWTIDRLRWLHAAILYLFGILVVYFVAPLGHAAAALLAADNGWGLFNMIGLPVWAAVVIGVLVFDLTQWACHWVMHRSPLLWRIHRLHHSDEVIDTSTAFRFHPAETLFRFLAQLVMVIILGVPVLAIVVTAFLSIAFDVWEHANATCPRPLQRLSRIIITPDLHRIHHSIDARHQNRNFGTILAVWDRLFGTYAADDELKDDTAFGLGPLARRRFRTLADLILDPVRKS